MRLAPLQPTGTKLGTVVGARADYFRRSPEVKGQVTFQVALIELKFGEGAAGQKASAKYLSRRMPSEVKLGQRSSQISGCSD